MLSRFSIKAKILSMIMLLGFISLCGMSLLAYRFHQVNSAYASFIQNETQAAILGARSSAGMWTGINAISRVAVLDAASPEFEALSATFVRNYAGAMEKMVSIGNMVPSRKPAASEIIASMEKFKAIYEEIVALKKAGKDAEALEVAKRMDTMSGDISSKSGANNTAMMAMITDGGKALSDQTSSDIRSSLIILVGAIIVVTALAFYVASAGITKPMERLRQRMQSLAKGDARAPVEGIERQDEIGAMAQTVEIFRNNEVERVRLAPPPKAAANSAKPRLPPKRLAGPRKPPRCSRSSPVSRWPAGAGQRRSVLPHRKALHLQPGFAAQRLQPLGPEALRSHAGRGQQCLGHQLRFQRDPLGKR